MQVAFEVENCPERLYVQLAASPVLLQRPAAHIRARASGDRLGVLRAGYGNASGFLERDWMLACHYSSTWSVVRSKISVDGALNGPFST